MYAIVENSKIVEFPIYNLRQRFPNISFPLSVADADLPKGVVRVHAVLPPTYPYDTHKPVQENAPVFRNQRWELGYAIAPLAPEELQQRTEMKIQEVRAERSAKLAASDWTQVADAPVNQAAWATYRQALRDITDQPGFPFGVLWPQEPAAQTQA